MGTFNRTQLVERLKGRLRNAQEEAEPYVQEALRRVQETARPDPPAVETPKALARRIDHTQLKPEATDAQIRMLCAEARDHGFASVCVNPCYVPLAAEELAGIDVRVCTVAGFPLGATSTRAKAYEAQQAIEDGADEVDMVQPIGRLRSRHYAYVEEDIRAVVEAAREASSAEGPALIKVILETALLTDEEKAIACVLALRAGADFVKTSTGFSTAGATLEDVALMRQIVGAEMGVKAAGGIRTYEAARDMIAHGATRIGASGSVAIVQGAAAGTGY